MTPTALASELREMREKAERGGWDDAVRVLVRAEQAVGAGHFFGLTRWHRQARKIAFGLASSAFSAQAAAHKAHQAASHTAPTPAELAKSLPDDPTIVSANLREWADKHAYKDEVASMREATNRLDQASAHVVNTAMEIGDLHTQTLSAAKNSFDAATNALKLLDDLVTEATQRHSPQNQRK